MSYIWPEYLPNPSAQFSGRAEGNTIRSTMESGRVRQRRRFTTELNTYAVTWELDDQARAMFKAVFRNKISHGNEWFTIDLPVNDGFQTVQARFTSGGYDETNIGVLHWTISATLEVESPPVWSEEILDAIDLIGLPVDNFENAVNGLHYLLNTTIPVETPL